MRKKWIGANWKMNLKHADALHLYESLSFKLAANNNLETVVFPPSVYLSEFSNLKGLALGAQNVSAHLEFGAFTGEISLNHLSDIQVNYIMIGHSERRVLFQETEEHIRIKVFKTLGAGLIPVLCIGESKEQRLAMEHFQVVSNQINSALSGLNLDGVHDFIIAYEPVWAIGTGLTATLHEIEEMHAFIRFCLFAYSEGFSERARIVYGGSCNADNIANIFKILDVDGALVGGASLSVESMFNLYESLC